MWIIVLLYILPTFIRFDFNDDLTVKSVGFGLPRVISGDEPHYFIALNSIIDDHDFLIKNNHANAYLNKTCDAGFIFKGNAQISAERRVMYTKNHQDYTLDLIDTGGKRLPGKENINLDEFEQVTLAPIGLPVESALFLWPFSNTCNREHFAILLSIFISIIGILFFHKIILYYHNTYIASVATFIYAFGTPIWFYSKTFFAEPYLATFLILAYYYLIIKNRSFLAGLFIGAGYLMKQPFSLLLPIFVVYTILRRKFLDAISLIVSFMPFLVMFFAFNLYHFSTFTTPAKQFTAGSILVGIYNNFFSSTNGLFVFSPILLLFIFGIIGFYRKNKSHCIIVVMVLALYFIFFSSFIATGGAHANRYFVPFLSFMVLLLSFAYQDFFTKYRSLFIFLIATSVVINLQSAVVHILFWSHPPWYAIEKILLKWHRVIELLTG